MRKINAFALVALALTGCHVDDEVEGQTLDTGTQIEGDASPRPDLSPDAAQPDAALPDAALPECEGEVEEACAITDDCGGTRRCADGVFGACTAPAEVCDGIDNDCDGIADNGFVGLGEACTAGLGACAAEGVQVCAPDGSTVICDAVAGAPSEEQCDGIDNNCDGTVDDGVIVGEPCLTGALGACAAGATVCFEGGIACAANTETSDEICDGLDNDCDGNTDEDEDGEALVRTCYDGPEGTAEMGSCVSGQQTCTEGAYGTCEGQVLPGIEICDTLDNDCNGTADDLAEGVCVCQPGDMRACYTGPDGTAGVGLCVMGSQACAADGLSFGACMGEILPAAELCDGLDNDCNGTVDDAATTGEICSAGVGTCERPGTRVCDVNAGAVVCNAVAAAPEVETCDSLDNDCNGTVDDVANLGDACANGVGTCAQAGVRVCDVPGRALVCNAVPGLPGVEVCDGLDNDCNGTNDNGNPGGGDDCPTGQLGVCDAGTTACTGGGLVCNRNMNPGPEVCDGIDNDCNGTIDNVANLGAACSNGVGACLRAGTRICDVGLGALVCNAVAILPVAETCDNIDNDCDNRIDEAVTRSCYGGPGGTVGVGACKAGTQTCAAGGFGACVGEVRPQDEACDGLDNDCNGTVDNYLAELVATAYPADRGCFALAVGDLNGDGRPDVVCVPNLSAGIDPDTRLFSYLQQANGTLGAARYAGAVPVSPFRQQSDVALGDIDGDGDLDAVVVGQTMKAYTYRNNGGNFANPVEAFDFAANGEPGTAGLVLRDLNADGRLDIATTVGNFRDNANRRLAVAFGNGNGTFQAPTIVDAVSEAAVDIFAGDVDNDGDLDIVGFTETRTLLWRRNGANFGAPEELSRQASVATHGLYSDINGDGRADLLIPSNDQFFIARGQANGLAAPASVAARTLVTAFALADLDCDPSDELVVVTIGDGPLEIHDGAAPGNPRLSNVNLQVSRALVSVDFNRDGFDDLVVGNEGTTGVTVLIQRP